jgi:uncharacterized protein YhaN
MEDEDREELLWRRVAEKVSEAVDKQIKRRYFWAVLLFAIASWFGGSALITSIVQLRVSDKMEPAERAVTKAQTIEDSLSSKLSEFRKKADTIDESMKDLTARLEDAAKQEKQLEQQLGTLQTNAGLAINQSNERIQLLGKAVTQLSAAQKSTTEFTSKLEAPHVNIRLGGDVSEDLSKELVKKLGDLYSVTAEGGVAFVGISTVRYYYKDEEPLAKQIATKVNDILRQLNVNSKPLPVTDLSGLPIKPPNHTFDLWLNFSGKELL